MNKEQLKKEGQTILGFNMAEGTKDEELIRLVSGDYSSEVIDQHFSSFTDNSKGEISLNRRTIPVLDAIEKNGLSWNFETLDQDLMTPLREEKEKLLEKPELYGMNEEVGTYKWEREVLEKNGYKEKSIRELKSKEVVNEGFLEAFLRVCKISKKINIYERLKQAQVNGKVHTNFIPFDGLSGRMTSYSPCIQNTPSEWKRYLNPSREGEEIFELDVMNAEILAAGKISGEESILEIIAEVDFYIYMASQILEVDEEKVTSDIRKAFKKVSNAINYGSGGANIAKIINEANILPFEISSSEGKDIKDEYFEILPKLKEYQSKQASAIKLETAKGHIFNLKESSYKNISFGPQNLIATLMKELLIALDEKGYTHHIVNVVHDSIWVSCDPSVLDDIKVVMSNVFSTLVEGTKAEGIELIKTNRLGGRANV